MARRVPSLREPTVILPYPPTTVIPCHIQHSVTGSTAQFSKIRSRTSRPLPRGGISQILSASAAHPAGVWPLASPTRPGEPRPGDLYLLREGGLLRERGEPRAARCSPRRRQPLKSSAERSAAERPVATFLLGDAVPNTRPRRPGHGRNPHGRRRSGHGGRCAHGSGPRPIGCA